MELLFVERTVVIRNKGSIEFSAAEQSADILLVDVRCDAIQGTEYESLKTLPSNGYYGDITLFGGATVRERISLRFVYQRVLDFESIYRRLRCYLTRIELQQTAAQQDNPNVFFDPLGNAVLPEAFEYRGLPYSKLKLNSERLAQHTVTVRHYKEDTGFACQSQAKPDDPTKGEPEYPEPAVIPPNGAFPGGLANPTDPYPGADPRDFPTPSQVGNFGVGSARYDFKDAATVFKVNTQLNIGYPGILIKTTASNGNKEISWRDNAGKQTVMVVGASPPVQVRAFRILVNNIVVYTPFVDALSNP